jgi:hypothetical protein
MTVRDATVAQVAEPVIPAQVVHDYAAGKHVCVRPLLRRVTDRETGDVQRLVIPCGSTREAVCPVCAEKARRLRMQQCAEGWHLGKDPLEATRTMTAPTAWPRTRTSTPGQPQRLSLGV